MKTELEQPCRSDQTIPGNAAHRQEQLDESARVARRLAHDYGNVLTSILGFCELAIRELSAESKAHRFLSKACESARSGADLTERIRMYAGNAPSSSQGCGVVAVLNSAWDALNESRGETRLIRDVPREIPALRIDEQSLRLIFLELLQNSLDATEGQGAITFETSMVPLSESEQLTFLGSLGTEECLRLRLRDTGRGLSAEAQEQLFQMPFFSDKPKQRGYGLSVVYGLLKANQGGFRLFPSEEKGTTVEMVLPLAPSGIGTVSTSSSAPQFTKPDDLKKRILVVDDESDILSLISFVLQGEGLEVTEASSAEEALTYITNQQPGYFSMMLTDWTMPGMQGPDLIREVLEAQPSLTVGLMSGLVNSQRAYQELADLSFVFLEKPFNPLVLTSTVRKALNMVSSVN